MPSFKLDLLIIEVKNDIAYGFSKEELKLYPLSTFCYSQFEIGTFVSCDIGENVNGVFECSGISRRADCPTDQIKFEISENGPILVMRSYIIFNRDRNSRSFSMTSGFSDWYGYIQTPYPSLRKKRGEIFVLYIVVHDLKYENKKNGCLFRHYEKGIIGKKYDLDLVSEIEQKEIEFVKPNSIENIPLKKSKSPTSENQMSKKSVEHRVLTLRHDLDKQHLYGYNKFQRSLMVLQLQDNKKVRIGSSVSFIVLSCENGVITPEIGSVNIDDQYEHDIINNLEDNIEIKTYISFSNCPNHFTYAKRLAFSDSYGFIDVSNFDINFQANYIYETVIRIKQSKNKDLPCFEAIKSPTVTHNFTHEQDFIQSMYDFEKSSVEKSRQNFGKVFTSEPQFERRPKSNPYYTKDNRNHNLTKSIVRHEYLQMLVVKLYEKPKNGVFGVATSVFGDADLNVTSDHSGTFQLKVGDWFKGVLDKKKNTTRFVVEKIETLVDCSTDFRISLNGDFIALTDLDLTQVKPSRDATTIYDHDLLNQVSIERKDYDLMGKRIFAEVLFVPDSKISWRLMKFIDEIPGGVAFVSWKINYDRQNGRHSNVSDANNQELFRPLSEDDEYEFDDVDNIQFTPSSSRHSHKPRKDEMEFNNKPSSNESRGYRQNYPAEDDEFAGKYNSSQYRQPPSQNTRSNSRAGSEFSQNNGYGKENFNSTRNGYSSSEKTIYESESRVEMGVVTQQLNENDTFVVYSSHTLSPVFYRLIPGSINARLGEFFEFRTRRLNGQAGLYEYEVTEVIEVLNQKDLNPMKIVGNMARIGVVLILKEVDMHYMTMGKFVVNSNDIGKVIFGENIDTPGQKHLSSEQFYDKYRTSPKKMMCFCQYEYGPSIDETHHRYRWVLQSCEGSFQAYSDKERLMEQRNLGNTGNLREDDDIARAKRLNAENARNPSYMSSSYSSRVPTPLSEQTHKPDSNRQPTEFASSSKQDSRSYPSEQIFDDSRPGHNINGGSPASSANIRATPRAPPSSSGSCAGGTEELDYKEMYYKLKAETRNLYKINDSLMNSNIRQEIKKYDTEVYEKLGSCLKKVRDLLSTTKK